MLIYQQLKLFSHLLYYCNISLKLKKTQKYNKVNFKLHNVFISKLSHNEVHFKNISIYIQDIAK